MTDSKLLASLPAAQSCLLDGDVRQAIALLQELENRSLNDHILQQQIAELYVQCGQHVKAGECYARSVKLQPSNPAYD